MKKEAMANAISENNSRQLWEEVRKIRNKNSPISNCIDETIGDVNIASLFANKYNDLYNSVSSEQEQMAVLLNGNAHDIENYCLYDVHNDMMTHTHVITIYNHEVITKTTNHHC